VSFLVIVETEKPIQVSPAEAVNYIPGKTILIIKKLKD
jgi:hypothetical protein